MTRQYRIDLRAEVAALVVAWQLRNPLEAEASGIREWTIRRASEETPLDIAVTLVREKRENMPPFLHFTPGIRVEAGEEFILTPR